jgi:hypothetical protein
MSKPKLPSSGGSYVRKQSGDLEQVVAPSEAAKKQPVQTPVSSKSKRAKKEA